MDTAAESLIERLRRLPTALRKPAIPLADLGLLRRPLVRTTATRLGLLVALRLSGLPELRDEVANDVSGGPAAGAAGAAPHARVAAIT